MYGTQQTAHALFSLQTPLKKTSRRAPIGYYSCVLFIRNGYIYIYENPLFCRSFTHHVLVRASMWRKRARCSLQSAFGNTGTCPVCIRRTAGGRMGTDNTWAAPRCKSSTLSRGSLRTEKIDDPQQVRGQLLGQQQQQ